MVFVSRLTFFAQLLAVAMATTAALTANVADAERVACIGDCNGNGVVTIDEIVTGVDMELFGAAADRCPAFECNTTGLGVFINCAVLAVRNALSGCHDGQPLETDGACCLGDCREVTSNCRPQSQPDCCYYARHSAIALAISWCPAEQFDAEMNHCASCVDACFGLPSETPAPTPTPTVPSGKETPAVNQTPYPLSNLQEPCWSETGAGLLAGIRPEYDGTLIIQRGPWNGPLAFSIRLTYRGGAITCYPPYVAPPGSTRPDRREQVGVVVEMQFTTENGAFAETVGSELRGGAHGGTVSFLRRPEDIEGTYRPDLPGYDDVLVGASGNFRGEWTNGVVFQSGIPPGHVSQFIPIAYWQPPTSEPPR